MSQQEDCLQFCALYRKESRTPREESSLSRLYPAIYDECRQVVAYIARKAGLFDEDIVADCAVTLLDFCAKEYAEDPKKTFIQFLRNIGHAYLRKHRDFLSFSKRITQTGYDRNDFMTQATYGRTDDEDRPRAVYAFADDPSADVIGDMHPSQIDPIFAMFWNTGVHPYEEPETNLDDGNLEEFRDLSLSNWVDLTISYVKGANLSSDDLSDRAADILEQLRAISGSPFADIAKRLISRTKGGCMVSRSLLLNMVRNLDANRNAGLLGKILPVLDGVEEEMPADDRATAESSAVEMDAASSEPVDLGFLIDPHDLYHGRVPQGKPEVKRKEPANESIDLGIPEPVAGDMPPPQKISKRRAHVTRLPAPLLYPKAVQIELRLGA